MDDWPAHLDAQVRSVKPIIIVFPSVDDTLNFRVMDGRLTLLDFWFNLGTHGVGVLSLCHIL